MRLLRLVVQVTHLLLRLRANLQLHLGKLVQLMPTATSDIEGEDKEIKRSQIIIEGDTVCSYMEMGGWITGWMNDTQAS